MNWMHFLLAVLAAGIISSFTDWFFGGILFHDKYLAYPEVWRRSLAKSEAPAVAWSIVLGFLTAAAFIFVCAVFHVRGYAGTLKLAMLCWLMIPVPLLITNALFIKLHPLVVVSHSLGWLTKLVVAALAAVLLSAQLA
ncbi:MAG TPA: hypothetical protein VLW83_16895 [Candidatus Acidoferrales bacterium]|nr:hypothetical protein [Candidatus Acidoferrales bacterium]